MSQLVGEKNDGVAGPSARDQDAEPGFEIAASPVAIVVDRVEVVESGQQQAPLFFLRFTVRIGKEFVLSADAGAGDSGICNGHGAGLAEDGWLPSGRSAAAKTPCGILGCSQVLQ